jgi:hypothetical protein
VASHKQPSHLQNISSCSRSSLITLPSGHKMRAQLDSMRNGNYLRPPKKKIVPSKFLRYRLAKTRRTRCGSGVWHGACSFRLWLPCEKHWNHTPLWVVSCVLSSISIFVWSTIIYSFGMWGVYIINYHIILQLPNHHYICHIIFHSIKTLKWLISFIWYLF